MRSTLPLLVAALATACALSPTTDSDALRVEVPDGVLVTSGAPFPDRWICGDRADEPLLHVHWYDADTVILRQSKRVDYEAPFLYLLFGDERALLLDTGSRGEFRLRETVDALMANREASVGHALELVVAHTHGHGDHVAHDADFEDRPNTVVVSPRPQKLRAFWGFENWPDEVASYDLGNRRLDLLPTPGHERSHLAIWDERTNVILSGDTFYPGFLFVFRPEAWEAFDASMRRLHAFAAERGATTFLGGHVEMSATPGVAYPYRTVEQPDETPLALSFDELTEVIAALDELEEPDFVTLDRIVLYPGYLNWADEEQDDEAVSAAADANASVPNGSDTSTTTDDA